ncbi:putative oxidoreductase [Dioscorea sansibarensis]
MDLTLCDVIIISMVLILITKRYLHIHFSKPLALPILGHLHLLQTPIHQYLTKLTQKHGHILHLLFGSRPVPVVSSRPPRSNASPRMTSSSPTVPAFFPPNIWVIASHPLCFRPSPLAGGVTGVSPPFTPSLPLVSPITSLNLMMGMITGKRFQGEEKRKLRKVLEEMFFLSGASSMEDFVPLVRWLGFSTMRNRMERVGKEMDETLQELLLEERSKLRTGDHGEDQMRTIIGNLLKMQEKEPEQYTDIDIKGILLSLITGGTETTSGTMEWAMALLVNHPEVLKKVRDEIEEHVGHARLVKDSDISKLKYLNNVIKETLRLFPPGPLLVPHESSEDCIVEGVCVPKGTMLLVNAYAMQRDPELWEDSMEFKPERFDEDQQGFKYIPFGYGRRRCPGESMGWKVMTLALGVLIQCFDWGGEGQELVDLSEGAGLSMPMATPLEVIYRPCLEMLHVLSQL